MLAERGFRQYSVVNSPIVGRGAVAGPIHSRHSRPKAVESLEHQERSTSGKRETGQALIVDRDRNERMNGGVYGLGGSKEN